MKVFTALLVAAAAVGGTTAFSAVPNTFQRNAHVTNGRIMMASDGDEQAPVSRRDALTAVLSTAVMASALPAFAKNDYVALDDVETKKPKKEAVDSGGKGLVLGVGGAGLALSLPFFGPNLLRLGKKLGSGGESDGYTTKKK